MVGLIGLVLVAIASVHQLGVGSGEEAGIPPGHRVPPFVAPLATGPLVGDVNLRPRCLAGHPNPGALNVCDGPSQAIVLALFATGSPKCVRSVDALQRVGGHEPGPLARVGVAAVAVGVGRATAARLVRRHGWTIPVAYDRDGALGESLGVAICPLYELIGPGGRVRARLVGERWTAPAPLRAQILAAFPGG